MRNSVSSIYRPTNQLSETEAKWFAVYTKYKCEKYVCEQLSKKNIACYVPVIERVKRYSSKIKRYNVPLINCYVFVKICTSDYVRVLQSEYVLKFLKQRKDLIAIPDEEIEILKKVVGQGNNIDVEAIDFEEGAEVEIVAGNMTGVRGRVLEKKGKNSIVIQLLAIGLQLIISVDKGQLRLIRPVVL